MSGHSKWHNIQVRKGKQDAKRANVFTKYAKGITIAAQKGGDPTTNFSLRLAIDKAKAVSMPKDNIDRAIKRGTPSSDGAGLAQLEEVLYEGFGPGGVAILIKTVTDNKNRTVSDLKHILNEAGGSFGSAGSVQWMFGQWGVVTIPPSQGGSRGVLADDLELALIEAGAEDISDVDGEIEIKTKIENLQKVLGKLKELGIEPTESGIRWVAKDMIKVSDNVGAKLGELFSELEAHDDVEDYFTNAD